MTRVLIAATGVDYWTLADGTRHPSGYWPEELSTPYQVFADAGLEITLATLGGVVPTADPAGFDPVYHGDSEEEALRVRLHLESIIERHPPIALEVVDVDDFDLVFVPGGWGPMEDLAESVPFGALLRRFADAGKPIAAVCHGPAALLPARDDDGGWLFSGREVTGFSNVEEYAVGTAPLAKWLVEDRLKAEGGLYSSAPEGWAEFVVVDGNLYTGQNPASARALAERLVLDTARLSGSRA
ncbi:type 1 glutamine amidotransferase domain-containing protein [Nocardioides sp. NPDC059952]|uniref:type 1 glutamine amidotransferase domain-containing protein n=1 Tax=Nocardioides sp. NPDC059952 TaxID=3347014 RepID=UPI00364BF349